MKTQTRKFLAGLKHGPWFASVGQPVEDSSVDVVSSWAQAVESCRKVKWTDLLIDMGNLLREPLFLADCRLSRTWGQHVQSVKPSVNLLVAAKFRALALRELPSIVKSHTRWILLHACLELEFTHLRPPTCNSGLARWICSGHYPCGWKGKFPDGRLVVY